ncbi:unnamed protein product [Amoebophrya sp. A120]|nr:unnamed protein product [Amoebophrya sp. A120]|eukprot:GSA120T00011430001.1
MQLSLSRITLQRVDFLRFLSFMDLLTMGFGSIFHTRQQNQRMTVLTMALLFLSALHIWPVLGAMPNGRIAKLVNMKVHLSTDEIAGETVASVLPLSRKKQAAAEGDSADEEQGTFTTDRGGAHGETAETLHSLPRATDEGESSSGANRRSASQDSRGSNCSVRTADFLEDRMAKYENSCGVQQSYSGSGAPASWVAAVSPVNSELQQQPQQFFCGVPQQTVSPAFHPCHYSLMPHDGTCCSTPTSCPTAGERMLSHQVEQQPPPATAASSLLALHSSTYHHYEWCDAPGLNTLQQQARELMTAQSLEEVKERMRKFPRGACEQTLSLESLLNNEVAHQQYWNECQYRVQQANPQARGQVVAVVSVPAEGAGSDVVQTQQEQMTTTPGSRSQVVFEEHRQQELDPQGSTRVRPPIASAAYNDPRSHSSSCRYAGEHLSSPEQVSAGAQQQEQSSPHSAASSSTTGVIPTWRSSQKPHSSSRAADEDRYCDPSYAAYMQHNTALRLFPKGGDLKLEKSAELLIEESRLQHAKEYIDPLLFAGRQHVEALEFIEEHQLHFESVWESPHLAHAAAIEAAAQKYKRGQNHVVPDVRNLNRHQALYFLQQLRMGQREALAQRNLQLQKNESQGSTSVSPKNDRHKNGFGRRS